MPTHFKLADLVVGKVYGVKLVLRGAKVLDGRNLVSTQFNFPVIERVCELRALRDEVGRDPHRGRARRALYSQHPPQQGGADVLEPGRAGASPGCLGPLHSTRAARPCALGRQVASFSSPLEMLGAPLRGWMSVR